MSAQTEALSTRARHTKLALSKALNVTITRAPPQASVRKMLARSKTAKRRLSGGGATESADLSDLLPGLLDADDGATSRADDALAQVVLGVCEDVEVRSARSRALPVCRDGVGCLWMSVRTLDAL